MSWGASTDAVGVTGYLISRCSGAGCTSFTQIASVSGTTLTYSNTGLSSATSYSYEVRATDAAGLYSGYSPIESATTPTGSGVSGSVTYGYDALGRLIQVASPTLSSVEELSYDAAGNISSNASNVITALKVANLSVDQTAAGEQITIDGSGFSATASADTVTINGVAATVTSASTTQLVVTVPSGATTGVVKVTVGGVAVSSTQSLSIVPAGAAPTIASFSPTEGVPGSTLTITGTNFSTTTADDKVLINGSPAVVTAATATSLTITVAADATAGPIQVVTPSGSALSSAFYFVPPTGYTQNAIGATGKIAENGSAVVATISTAGAVALEAFSGNEGDLLTIGVSALMVPNATLSVFTPAGLLLTSGSITAAGQGLQIPELPSTGAYTIVVSPSGTGSVTLSVASALQSTLTLGAAPTTITLSPPGRYAKLSFAGTAGAFVTVNLSAVTLTGAVVSILDPNGALVLTNSFGTAGITLQPQLSMTGTYSLVIAPSGSIGGSLNVALGNSPVATFPSVTSSGSTYLLNVPNQNAVSATFDGTAGQYVALAVVEGPGSGTGIGGATIIVSAPNGAVIASSSFSADSTGGVFYAQGIVNLGPLPLSGAYTITIQQSGSTAGSLSLTVSTPLSGSLAIGAGASTTILVQGQGLQESFTGAAGQLLSLVISEGDTQIPSLISGALVTVLAPNGAVLVTGTMTAGAEPTLSILAGELVLNLPPLPVSGTYTVIVQQTITAGPYGTLTLTLSSPVTSTLSVGSASTVATTLTGQAMQLTFTGIAGQYLALAIGEIGTDISGESVTIVTPNGAVLTTGVFVAGCASPCMGFSGYGLVNIGPLPQAGTYMVILQQPSSTGVGTLTLTLSPPVSGTLAVGSASTVATSLIGQPMQLTFTGTAGQYLALTVSEILSDISGETIRILTPNGAVLTTGVFVPGCAFPCSSYSGSGVVNIGPLPQAGTYTVLLQQPSSIGVGTLTLTLALGTTTATLVSSANPSTYGSGVTLTATVTGGHNPTGSITFKDASTSLGVAALTAGTARISTSTLATGTHAITAAYSGDVSNLPSSSATLSQTVVVPVATTITWRSGFGPPASVVVGDSFSPQGFIAGSTEYPPTGTVTVLDGTNVLTTTAVFQNGSPEFAPTIAMPTVGSRTLVIQYSGDVANIRSSLSTPITVYAPIATTVTLVNGTFPTTPNPATVGQTVTLSAVITGGTGPLGPTGTVTFKDGATVLGTGTANFVSAYNLYQATMTTSTLAAGSHSLTAVYSGDSSNLASTSPELTELINPEIATSVTLANSTYPTNPNPAGAGETVTINAFVTGGTGGLGPTGTVMFKDGATVIGTEPVTFLSAYNLYEATMTTTTLAVGSHSLTAVYGGDASNAGSTSPVLIETINPVAATSITWRPYFTPPTTLTVGQSVYAQGFVNGSSTNPPTGNVTILDGSTLLQTSTIFQSSGAEFLLSATMSTPGSRTIVVQYPGDSANGPSSLATPITVNPKATSSFAWIQYFGPPATVTHGVPFAVQGYVSGVPTAGSPAPTGTVTFLDGTTVLTSTTIFQNSGAEAAASITMPTAGARTLVVQYSGDASNNPCTVSFPITVQ